MIPAELKEFFVPGSVPFLLLSLIPAVLLLFRKRDGGRTGKIWVASLVLVYWVLSTPIAAVALVGLLTPDVPPVMSEEGGRAAVRRSS